MNNINDIHDVIENTDGLTNQTLDNMGLKSIEDLKDVIIMIDKMSTYLQTNSEPIEPTVAMNISQHMVTLMSQVIDQNVWTDVKSAETVELASKLLKHKNRLHLGDRVECVFWDFIQSKWSSDGCHVMDSESNREITVCECNHLTNFAALMDTSGREDNKPKVGKYYHINN
ncbi:unnamed protein product [Oppiella nova]|uniref:GAIN-B domain-containing protein n=1 Tax=Oppiella nova TaxID=334625 RepID=A0A7R9LPB0_9ACAR|nr:unnamed protein product [Oppiella nova]CAG2165641.1 unnamed protein product [Oppiella nova]